MRGAVLISATRSSITEQDRLYYVRLLFSEFCVMLLQICVYDPAHKHGPRQSLECLLMLEIDQRCQIEKLKSTFGCPKNHQNPLAGKTTRKPLQNLDPIQWGGVVFASHMSQSVVVILRPVQNSPQDARAKD